MKAVAEMAQTSWVVIETEQQSVEAIKNLWAGFGE